MSAKHFASMALVSFVTIAIVTRVTVLKNLAGL